MKKTKKGIITAVTSLSLACVMLFSVACNPESTPTNTPEEAYKISVVYAENNQAVTDSNIVVTFSNPTVESEKYTANLGANGTLEVAYETLNEAVTSDTKSVTISNYSSDYYLVESKTVSMSSRSATLNLAEHEYYTITVKYDSGVLCQNSQNLSLVFGSGSSTYSTPVDESGITSVKQKDVKDIVTSSSISVTVSGLDLANYDVTTATLNDTTSTATITITPKVTVEALFAEQYRANPSTELTINSWLMGLANEFIFPANNPAREAVYANGSVAFTTYTATVNYAVTYNTDSELVLTPETGAATKISVIKVTVSDQADRPVKDAYLRLTYYYDLVANEVTTGISHEAGVIFFYAPIVEGRTYEVRTQDFSKIDVLPEGVTNPIPKGYSAIEENFGIVRLTNNEKSVIYPVIYSANNFYKAISKQAHSYARYIYGMSENGYLGAGEKLASIQERNEDLELNITEGIYSYVSFAPYLEPGGSTMTEVDERQAEADKASSGTYRISLVTSDPNAKMIYFASTFMQDEFGIPTNIGAITGSGSEAYYTGTNYVDLNLRVYRNDNRNIYWFAVVSETDCEATIKVERLGDAQEPPAETYHEVTPSKTLTKCEDIVTQDPLNDMPINGSFTAVYVEAEDRYHVNSATGPILYAQLTKNMTRLFFETHITLENLPRYQDLQDRIYIFSTSSEDGTYITDRYDYNGFVKAYCEASNAQGLYPVTQELKGFLEKIAENRIGSCTSEAAKGYEWYSYCQYYGVIDAAGEGTEASPYFLSSGTGYVTLKSTPVHAKITLGMGVHVISSPVAVVNYTGDLPHWSTSTTTSAGVTTYYTYITVTNSSEEVRFTLSGTEGRTQVTINTTSLIENTINDSYQGTDASGISEATAIKTLPGVYNIYSLSESLSYPDDPDKDQTYTYLKVEPLLATRNGVYEIRVNGCGVLEYNGQTYTNGQVLEVNLEVGNPIIIKLSSKDAEGFVDGNFMLAITAKPAAA